MGIYSKGKKIGGLAIGGKKVAGAYLNGKKVFSAFLSTGTVLAKPGKAFGTYNSIDTNPGIDIDYNTNTDNILINKTLPLNTDLKRLKQGIQINMSKVVVQIVMGSNGGIFNLGQSVDPNGLNKDYKFWVDTPNVKIPLVALKTGNYIHVAYAGEATSKPSSSQWNAELLVRLVDTSLQFRARTGINSSVHFTFDNSTVVEESGSIRGRLIIDSITAY